MKEKSIFISIIGKPNGGKSSLLNEMLGEKIAITSHKPQTTRTKITGILTKEETQLVFLDTPGMHKPKNKLSQHMVTNIERAIGDVDINLLVVEAGKRLNKGEEELISRLKERKSSVILVINKIDTLESKELLLEQILTLEKAYNFLEIIPVSALKRDGIDNLVEVLISYGTEGPHYFSPDDMTDQPEKVIVAELIREKILNYMYDEIPHGVAVEIEKMRHRENSHILEIDCTIYCEKKSHKGMIIGKKGEMLKRIGKEAREEAEKFLHEKIFLQCWVKVKDEWRNKETFIKNFGLNS